MSGLDSLNAPQYVDFENMTDQEDVDKFFDVDYERRPSPSRRDTFEVLVPTTPQVLQLQEQEQQRQSEGNKENRTPVSVRKRRHSSRAATERSQNVLADLSTYLTPGTSKRKSQVAYMDNGRSVLVQNYDGIALMTPNKTHLMETRLDSEGMQQLVEEEPAVEVKAKSPEQPPTVTVQHDAASVPPARRPEPPRYRAPMVVHHPAQAMEKPKNTAPTKAVKFVAAAEVVHHFQKDTPERFHSRPARSALEKKLHINKAPVGPRPNTIPKSPFLTTKMRQNNRYVEPVPTQAEREQKELEEIKKHPIKANPLHRKILMPLSHKDVFRGKTPTKPEPFKLSQGKRKEPTPEPVFRFKAQAVPKGILNSPKGIPPRQEVPLTNPQSPALRVTAKYPKRVKMETPGQDRELAHFGVENITRITPSRVTKVQPFSFEERDRKMLEHKQELIEKAHKKPNFSSPFLPERKPLPVTRPHTPQLSAMKFGATQQQKFQQQLLEEERRQKEAAVFRARPVTVTHKKPFEPKLPNRKVSAGSLKLSTEIRAAERASFDEKLRQKELEDAELNAQREALREAEAREEIAHLRREAEFKATALRMTSPMKVLPSTKPLTDPQSPNLLIKERASRSMRQQ
ncbi:hypothetical protein B566_EDAN001670 [Ephemera danica]|nr:hypothetical protein B566_EDAN001670 [Ephemera danica]